MSAIDERIADNFSLYLGDSCQVAKDIPDNCIDFGIHSPPFSNLYIYSDSEADMGNCVDDAEFIRHYEFLIAEMFRITVPGRLCAVHCKDLPKYANRDDTAGLKDFPGMIIAAYERHGWSYHSRVTIWKCPVVERERTNNNGLLHKTVLRDRSQLRQGMADFLLVFRKPPVGTLMSDKPICKYRDVVKIAEDGSTYIESEPVGFEEYVGEPEYDPRINEAHPSPYARGKNRDRGTQANSIDIWRRYAEPVWWDICQTDVLNKKLARGESDERHICLARDSMVLTKERGYVPIQDVEIGEHTLTHMGRWRPVIAKEKTADSAKVVRLRAQGVFGLTLTPTHKLWARSSKGTPSECRKDRAKRFSPDWVEAGSCANSFVNLKLPPVEYNDTSEEVWWIVGRWIADGHVDQRDCMHISAGEAKVAELRKRLGNRSGFEHETTATQILVRDPDREIRDIVARCGRGAANKKLPPEAFTLEESKARALLDGYLSGDGHYDPIRKRWNICTVSRELAIGLQLLIQRAYGSIATLHRGRGERKHVIEGREVNAKTEWIVTFNEASYTHGFIADDGAWKPVNEVAEAGEAETWNLRVEEDSSYTAEGCVVKNCPLQLGLIERAVSIWSLPGEIVFSPFAGIGSEGVGAIRHGRKFLGIELKKEYFEEAERNLKDAVKVKTARKDAPSLFNEAEDTLEV